MEKANKAHWEKVYETKSPNEVSWTQEVPEISLAFIRSFHLPKSAKIIDVGGGESKLVNFLLDEGYEHITVLDISAKALEKAKQRLGNRAEKITWVVSDITDFTPTEQYDLWHDRAVFHFLTSAEDVQRYVEISKSAVTGNLIIGTFSENGPTRCSGLDIQQYTEASLPAIFTNGFDLVSCKTEDHTTPFDTTQNFLFCSFKRKISQ